MTFQLGVALVMHTADNVLWFTHTISGIGYDFPLCLSVIELCRIKIGSFQPVHYFRNWQH